MSITIPKLQKKPDKKTEVKRFIIADTSKVGNLVPAFIPNAAIVKALEESCKVQSIVMETSTSKVFESIPTGIRRLVLAGNKDEIPHVFNIVNPNMASSLE